MRDPGRLPVAMTIAGSDSGGGAGIQADLKTFQALGVYGASTLTAITAQNTLGVTAVHEIPTSVIAAQIDAVCSDIGIQAAKTGMLSSAEIIATVAERVRHWRIEQLVVDPVMVAKSGDRLLRADAVQALIEQLLPLALVLTPNLPEAEVLVGHSLETDEQIRQAAHEIVELGPKAVVMKGGHRTEDAQATDVLFDGQTFHVFSSERVETPNTHGTGCTFSAAIAASLAQGADVVEAVGTAKRYLSEAIRRAGPLGAGHGPVRHDWLLSRASLPA
jgi:hydroxymethylpyrimidine/phosphomethylpyrimidine kinase